jgi:hypothetical protein
VILMLVRRFTPRAIARARPSPVLAMIRLRSNSANPPSTVSIGVPSALRQLPAVPVLSIERLPIG